MINPLAAAKQKLGRSIAKQQTNVFHCILAMHESVS